MTTIVSSGDNIVITTDGRARSYPKTSISTRLRSNYLAVYQKGKSILRVTSSNLSNVTNPSAASLGDLQDDLLDLLEVSGSGETPATSSEIANSTTFRGVGDSFINFTGAVSVMTQLSTLTGVNIVNDGVGGETSAQMKTRFLAAPEKKNFSFIIDVGRNDITQGVDIAVTRQNIADVIAFAGHDRYVVVSVANRSTEPSGHANHTKILALNANLQTDYGVRYADVRSFMITQGTGTGQDAIDAAADVMPVSLRVVGDDLHYNTVANRKFAEYINANKLQYLIGSAASKPVTVEGLIKSLPNGRLRHDLAIGGSYYIGSKQTIYAPDQDSFVATLVIGNGGRGLVHSTGVEGYANTIIGYDAGMSLANGDSNTFIGTSSGKSQTSAIGCTFIGYGSGQNNVNGSNNTFVGNQAGINNASGQSSVAIGSFCLTKNTGGNNTAAGYQAGENYTGTGSLFLGYRAGRAQTSGNGNIYIGPQAGETATTGANNLVIGNNCAPVSLSGSNQLNIKGVIFGQGANATGSNKAGTIGISIDAATNAYFKVPGSTTTIASINIPAGVAPTAPVNEDMWFVGDDMFRRIGGVTKKITFA